MTKDKLIYALSDYKQLVLAYKSKYAELIKRLTFWKTSVMWLFLLAACISVALMVELSNERAMFAELKAASALTHNRIEALDIKLRQAERELTATKEELNKKDAVIKQLEQNISNASKKLLEKLLKEQGQ
jgi:septal ring factor EnvC (AmiA/AmiB activator)